MAVISRDVFILVGAAAINIVTGFRGFRPLLGKINTTVQIVAIARLSSPPASLRHRLLPAHHLHHRLRLRRPFRRSLRLFVSKLVNEDRREQTDTQQKLTTTHSGIILTERSRECVKSLGNASISKRVSECLIKEGFGD